MNTKLFFSLLFSTVLCLNALAQSKANPEERARRLTERMQNELSLTAEQSERVLAINMDAAMRMEKAHKQLESEEKKAYIQKLQADRREQLKEVLTEEQLEKAQAIVEERRKGPKR